jgi:hypothetical protein
MAASAQARFSREGCGRDAIKNGRRLGLGDDQPAVFVGFGVEFGGD